MSTIHRCIATALLGLLTFTAAVWSGPPAGADEGDRCGEMLRLGLRGVYFVETAGQWPDGDVRYGFKTRGLDIAFRESSFTMHLSRKRSEPGGVGLDSEPGRVGPTRAAKNAAMHSPDRIRSGSLQSEILDHLALTITFPGSNLITPRGAQPQSAKFNYFVGDDESRWASNAPSFGAIIYEGLYDGVDLLISGNDDGVLKYEFNVAAGADWSRIRITYDGVDSQCVDECGDLRMPRPSAHSPTPHHWCGRMMQARQAQRAPRSPRASRSSMRQRTASPSTVPSIRSANSSSIPRSGGWSMLAVRESTMADRSHWMKPAQHTSSA